MVLISLHKGDLGKRYLQRAVARGLGVADPARLLVREETL